VILRERPILKTYLLPVKFREESMVEIGWGVILFWIYLSLDEGQEKLQPYEQKTPK
jgi:hypothetical protein